MAPIAPFFSDSLFQNLNSVTRRQEEASVHHALFPKADESKMDKSLEERVQLAQDISSLALSLRKKVNIKVRQPLQKILIPVLEGRMKKQIQAVEELIKTEINVKEIAYLENNDGFIKKKIKPNYVLLGKRMGPRMKTVAEMIGNLSQEDIAGLEKVGHISLLIDNEPVILQAQEVEITSEDIPGWMVANKEGLTVALDVNITPVLESEGYARELVNRIQKIRKDSDFELTDRIIVKLTGNQNLKDAVARFNSYICAEILADQLDIMDDLAGGTEVEINDIPIKVIVTKKA